MCSPDPRCSLKVERGASSLQQMASPVSCEQDASSTSTALQREQQGHEGSEDLRAIFDHFDENKDGKISKEEMRRSLERLGMSMPCADELADMVNYEEFVGLYYETGGPMAASTDMELRQAFEVFDQDGDGLITAQELQSVLQSMGVLEGRSLADCAAMIRRVDSDDNGQVDFQEFKLMMSGFG